MPMIHENLKLLRQARGMTQADIADAIHVTRQTISSYESGRTQPDLETLKRLAEVYQADIQDILYGSNRLQRKIKLIKGSVYGLVAVMLLGLLIHSILLWAMEAYFPIQNATTITESNSQMVEFRFALRDSAYLVSLTCTAIFRLGCLLLLYPLATIAYMPPLKKRIAWLLGLTASACAIVIPWFILSGGKYYGNYFLPVYKILPSALLVFVVTQLVDILRKRKNR